MNHFAECYYCVCTACSRSRCPWKHRYYMHCFACHDRGKRSPRLHCDFFEHYLKTHRYRFKRASRVIPEHFGTYILISSDSVMVGKYEKLYPLWRKLGGELRKFDIIRD